MAVVCFPAGPSLTTTHNTESQGAVNSPHGTTQEQTIDREAESECAAISEFMSMIENGSRYYGTKGYS